MNMDFHDKDKILVSLSSDDDETSSIGESLHWTASDSER